MSCIYDLYEIKKNERVKKEIHNSEMWGLKQCICCLIFFTHRRRWNEVPEDLGRSAGKL